MEVLQHPEFTVLVTVWVLTFVAMLEDGLASEESQVTNLYIFLLSILFTFVYVMHAIRIYVIGEKRIHLYAIGRHSDMSSKTYHAKAPLGRCLPCTKKTKFVAINTDSFSFGYLFSLHLNNYHTCMVYFS